MGSVFAVIPGAGHSRRMGRPKLLLEIGGRTVIARLLETFRECGIAEIFVTARRADTELQAAIQAGGATVVTGHADPPDMRASVQMALDRIEALHHPGPEDAWLMTPADHPLLDSAPLQTLLACWTAKPAAIMVPTFEGRRGHPTLFSWELVAEVRKLPPDVGLNALVHRFSEQVVEVEVNSPGILVDLDTPEDLERVRGEFGGDEE